MTTELQDDAPADPGRDRRGRDRQWLPMTLVVVATVIAVFSAITTWVHTQALNTDEWVDVSTELIDEPQIQDALATYLVNELYDNVDVAAELQQLLPDSLSKLAGPIAGALRDPATNAVDRVIASSQFRTVWADANRLAHQALVKILRDDTRPAVSTANGAVVLDLRTALENTAQAIGLPGAVVDRIPEGAGQIVVFSSSELADAQKTVQVLDFLSWFLFLLVVVLYVLAVVLSKRRRSTLFAIGVGFLIGGLTLLFLRAIGIRSTVLMLVDDSSNRTIATIAGQVITELLRQSAWIGIILGVLIMVFAALLGERRWARTTRHAIGPWMQNNGVVVGAAVVLLLLLAWWSPGRMFTRWYTALTLVALVIGAVIAFTVQCRRELAAAPSGGGGGGGDGGSPDRPVPDVPPLASPESAAPAALADSGPMTGAPSGTDETT
jgi:hypothetical protein